MRAFFQLLFAVLSLSLLGSCSGNDTLFDKLSSSHTGIHFSNQITETDSVNVLDLANVYNGGGVGIGDFNRDGLQDIYFTGNMVSNKLYLNKGSMKFDDITAAAGVDGQGEWCRGVSVVDINNDGWPDIYVCANILKDSHKRRNLLYINQGVGQDHLPHFKESAAEYGLDDTAYSTMATFFDYDNDGDLDMFLAVNVIPEGEYPNKFRPLIKDGSYPSTCKLYRNDSNTSLKHPYFTNVSKQAGITLEGYTHAATIADINQDGWKDIYVTNDYLSPNVLYINNHDGTFTDESSVYFKHTSANAMGNDIEDINNDGYQDVFELDMNPHDEYRKKMMMNVAAYQTYQNSDYFGYQYQYVRNTLQLNQGPRVNGDDSLGPPIFSEISFLSGVAETDWSWAPMVTDFDNDGYRDIIVTNGFPKDITDHDFVSFRNQAFNIASKKMLLSQIPEVKINNYAFHNNGDLTFTDVSAKWGINTPSFSNGAAYADLDNDGDEDYVVNNINDEASVYENHANDKKGENHYLNIHFSGTALNRNGIGAWAGIYYDHGKKQVYENTPYRGYLSTVEGGAHFGLGNTATIDSVVVRWPNGKKQVLRNVKADQLLTVSEKNAAAYDNWQQPVRDSSALFTNISGKILHEVVHKEDDFVDFNVQKLLPHKLSDYGPALAVADVNKDGLDDIVMGGSTGYSSTLLLQQKDGRFVASDMVKGASGANKVSSDMGILLFDADNDGDEDCYIAAGGYQDDAYTKGYSDQLYLNDGHGNFTPDAGALPANFASKSCVRAIDIDNDGDLDLFVAGRCVPSKYPLPVSCFIYRNDSHDGKVKFTDISTTAAKDLADIGMTCDAVFTDFDNDGWKDLVLTGEFMPVKFFKNNHGRFEPVKTDIDKQVGWWNSILPGDFDNDGDIDFIIGNVGRNSYYRPTDQYPVRVYAKDFDNNGNFDAIPSLYLPTSSKDTTRKEYPAHLRDELIKQMIEMRTKFKSYKEFATAGFSQLLSPDELKKALILQANNFKTSFIRNDGNGRFTMTALPVQAQFSSVFGMLAEDVNGDGNLDVIMNANDYGTEVSVGQYDAMNGLVMLGDGHGHFRPLSIAESGIFIPGNGKALVKLRGNNGKCMIAASQNRGPLEIFALRKTDRLVPFNTNDSYALIKLKNGQTRKTECYYGAGFLSQSGMFINVNDQVQSLVIVDNRGNKRVINGQ